VAVAGILASNPNYTSRVLVIDDEPLLAQTLRLALSPAHEVVAAAGGGEALALLATDQHFDLILCDLMMSEISGVEILRWLEESAPALLPRFVITTGGAYTSDADTFLRHYAGPYLDKPFRAQDVESLLAQLQDHEAFPSVR
jgi:two-component system NtrC family sensor kinase